MLDTAVVGMFHNLCGSDRNTVTITKFLPYAVYDKQNYSTAVELREAVYVTMAEYKNKKIVAYQSDDRIHVVKFGEIEEYTANDIIPMLSKLLDVFSSKE